jgi:hypothetical protein
VFVVLLYCLDGLDPKLCLAVFVFIVFACVVASLAMVQHMCSGVEKGIIFDNDAEE